MTGLSDDASATGHGFLTLALVGVFFGLLQFIAGMLFAGAPGAAVGVAAIIAFPIIMIAGFFIGYSIFHLFAKMFGGQATGMQFFRVIANTLVMTVPVVILSLIIPYVGQWIPTLSYVWFLVVLIIAVQNVHKLSTGKAVAAVLIPAIILAVVTALYLQTISGGFA